MSFPYKNPLSSSQLTGVNSVPTGKVYGTNFSVLQTGGYMEVYSLSDLGWTTNNATGNIEYSGNTIPIQFSKGFGVSPNSLILNSRTFGFCILKLKVNILMKLELKTL